MTNNHAVTSPPTPIEAPEGFRWYSTKQAGHLLGIGDEAVRRRWKLGKLTGRVLTRAQGKAYEILLEDQGYVDVDSPPTPNRDLTSLPSSEGSLSLVTFESAVRLAEALHIENQALHAQLADERERRVRAETERDLLRSVLDRLTRPNWRRHFARLGMGRVLEWFAPGIEAVPSRAALTEGHPVGQDVEPGREPLMRVEAAVGDPPAQRLAERHAVVEPAPA